MNNRASPRVCQILLGKFYVLPTFRKVYQVKKEFIPTVWHNSLTKLRSNLHQEFSKNQNYGHAFHLLETDIRNPSLFFISFFTLPPRGKQRWQPRSARAYMRVGRSVLPSWFVKLLETNFSRFAKIRWMPS
jgi:hypothetical protein